MRCCYHSVRNLTHPRRRFSLLENISVQLMFVSHNIHRRLTVTCHWWLRTISNTAVVAILRAACNLSLSSYWWLSDEFHSSEISVPHDCHSHWTLVPKTGFTFCESSSLLQLFFCHTALWSQKEFDNTLHDNSFFRSDYMIKAVTTTCGIGCAVTQPRFVVLQLENTKTTVSSGQDTKQTQWTECLCPN